MTADPPLPFYRLIDDVPLPSGDGPGFEPVAQVQVGPFWISTVFLGVDTNHHRQTGEPLLFETMVFDGTGPAGAVQLRCATLDQARAQHLRAVKIAGVLAPLPDASMASFHVMLRGQQ
jgi:hypothetical protein